MLFSTQLVTERQLVLMRTLESPPEAGEVYLVWGGERRESGLCGKRKKSGKRELGLGGGALKPELTCGCRCAV